MILKYPNPFLNKKSELIIDEFSSTWLYDLIKKMEETVYQFKANGLAAVQLGINKSIIIYKDKDGVFKSLCNAKIISRFGKVKSYNEGCLSLPDHRVNIRRSKEIKVKAQSVNGDNIIIKEKGYTSIILQHEIDHLNGITIIDRENI